MHPTTPSDPRAEGPAPPPGAGERASPRRGDSPWALAAAGLALVVLVAALLAGLGSRWGWWSFRTGFDLLRWAIWGALVVVALAIVALVRSRGGRSRRDLPFAGAALLIALVLVGTAFSWHRRARQAPAIHDISTDLENPPSFVAIAPRRADAPNPVEHGGPEVALEQRAAYPDVRPLILELAAPLVFQRAVEVVREEGWEVVDADAAAGRIEATDRTLWFGFEDDVVIRLTPLDGRTLVDVRSVSRVGRGDAGTNARRVRAFLEAMGS